MSNIKAKNDLPVSEIFRLLRYDGETLMWNDRRRSDFISDCSFNRWHSLYANKPAGSKTSKGYLMFSVTLSGKKYYMLNHRAIWVLSYGSYPEINIDHINHNKTDNRLCNLRLVDSVGNGRNVGINRNNGSGFNGVSFNKNSGRFVAYLNVNKKRKHLGTFDTFEEAVLARKSANKKFGYHLNHGAQA